MTLKTPAPVSHFTHAQRVAFAHLERAISDFRIAPTQEAKDAVWTTALECTACHLLFVLTKEERQLIRECVPARVLLTRPLTSEEKSHE